ncbi:PREDICTED: suppressor protein SRP40 [Ipomoea nil]|uniref:suppressor protein SRP40 n=1 Tax=Ipomoea nil TaxID=35883 RepID=UPI0009009759|nr:PREDICTED: suppressor protein SRP40 [Ipomoea nil]
MPSGAKKRKAAKKKKESEVKGASQLPNSTSLPAPLSHGEEDLKHHDDKDSDGGELCSPASQDNRSQDQFVEGDEEEGDKKVVVEEESVIHVERELKGLDEPRDQDINVECIESSRGSHEGGSLKSSTSSSSSSSSDDESDAAVKNKITVDNSPTGVENELDSLLAAKVTDSILETETCKSDVGAVTSIELDKTAISEEMIQVEDNAMTSYAIQSDLMKNEEKKLGVDDESASISEVRVGATQENGVKQPTPAYDTPEVDVSTGADPIKYSEIPECSDSQPPVGSVLQPVQTTSWKGCCGLFELFTGSSR